MRRSIATLALMGDAAATAGAQAARATIDPGMTKAQVVERLGKPASERMRGDFTYLFYGNGCERSCGTSDLVILEKDRVVDAVFRRADRAYTGTSSSPQSISSIEAAAAAATRRPSKLRVPGAAERSQPRAVVSGVDVQGAPPFVAPPAPGGAPTPTTVAAAPAPVAAAAPAVPPAPVPADRSEPAAAPAVDSSPAAVPAGAPPLIIRVTPSATPADTVKRTP